MRNRVLTVGVWALTLVIAASASATAATLITGKQIKDGSITAADLQKSTITPAKMNKEMGQWIGGAYEISAKWVVDVDAAGTPSIDLRKSFSLFSQLSASQATHSGAGVYTINAPGLKNWAKYASAFVSIDTSSPAPLFATVQILDDSIIVRTFTPAGPADPPTDSHLAIWI